MNNGSLTKYLYDGTNVMMEQLQGVGNATVMLGLRLDEHLARTSATGVTRYFLTDAQGSTIALTDANGTIQTQYSYGPFGQTVVSGQASDNPYQFVGHEIEIIGAIPGLPSFTMYNFRARYFDVDAARFVSSDPAGFAGGSRNLYAYAASNPINLLDPTGMMVGGFAGGFPYGGGVSPGWGDVEACFAGSGSASAATAAAANAAEDAFSSNQGHAGEGGAASEAGSGLAPGFTVVAGGYYSLTVGSRTIMGSFGVGFDSDGHIAGLFTGGGGWGVGTGSSIGGFAQYSNGSVGDLSGVFGQNSVGFNGIVGFYFAGPGANGHGYANGAGVSVGTGVGVSGSSIITTTGVYGLNY